MRYFANCKTLEDDTANRLKIELKKVTGIEFSVKKTYRDYVVSSNGINIKGEALKSMVKYLDANNFKNSIFINMSNEEYLNRFFKHFQHTIQLFESIK